MTRRDFVVSTLSAAFYSSAPSRLQVPVYRIMDGRAHSKPEELRWFYSSLWPEAVRDFQRGGLDLQVTDGPGEVKHSPGDRPIFVGLRRGVINLVVTGHIPMYWDAGRGWAGVTTIYEGYHICLIALKSAHGDQIPYLSVNTCVHELLHALMGDIYLKPPKWYQAGGREFRIDGYATQMWIFHSGAAVRDAARAYLRRLKGGN